MPLKVLRSTVFINNAEEVFRHAMDYVRARKATAIELLKADKEPPDQDYEVEWSEVETERTVTGEQVPFTDLEDALAYWNWDAVKHEGGLQLVDALDDYIPAWQFELFQQLGKFIDAGGVIEFEKDLDGSGYFFYQWFFDGVTCVEREGGLEFKPLILDQKALAKMGLEAMTQTRLEPLSLMLMSVLYNLKRLGLTEIQIEQHPAVVLIVARMGQVGHYAIRYTEKERQARLACEDAVK